MVWVSQLCHLMCNYILVNTSALLTVITWILILYWPRTHWDWPIPPHRNNYVTQHYLYVFYLLPEGGWICLQIFTVYERKGDRYRALLILFILLSFIFLSFYLFIFLSFFLESWTGSLYGIWGPVFLGLDFSSVRDNMHLVLYAYFRNKPWVV